MAHYGETVSLNGDDWTITGWYPHFWRMVKSVELSHMLKPVVPPIPATVPGAVQLDLKRAGLALDPNVALNSMADEWIPNREWIYDRHFRINDIAPDDGERLLLVFEGLDFHGEIFLNGEHVRDFSGMFVPVEIDITEKALRDQPNHLRVAFYQTPEVEGQAGYSSRVKLIKSRFNYNWDWCARIVPVGIWDDVYLKRVGTVRLRDFWPRAILRNDNASGALELNAELTAPAAGESCVIEWRVSRAGYEVTRGNESLRLLPHRSIWRTRFELAKVEPWWPNGAGAQALYDVEIRVTVNGRASDQAARRVGFKRIHWVPNPGAPPTAMPYTAIVNGKRLFLRGVNWVPISPFYGGVRREDYDLHVGRLVEMNCNILRVWGGAIIEKRDFYDVCDERGLLVWQELLQSSSGVDNYPSEDPLVINELSAIAEVAIRRRRHHAALAIWCGGNELMYEGLRPVGEEHVMLRTLGRIVRDLSPDSHYIPTSASGPVNVPSESDYGKGLCHDVHGQWVYIGEEKHYSYYNKDDSLWRSEAGAPGLSVMEALREMGGAMPLWPPDTSNRLWLHHGPWWIMWQLMTEHFGPWDSQHDEMELYTKLNHWLQAEALRYIFESVRRREPQSSASLIWMGNEPYNNGGNTSVIDYKARPKPCFYAVQEVFSGANVSLRYRLVSWKSSEDYYGEVFAHSEYGEFSGTAELLDAEGTVIESWAFQFAGDTPALKVIGIEWRVTPLPHSVFFIRLRWSNQEKTYCFTIDQQHPFAALRHVPQTRLSATRIDNALKVRNEGACAAIQVFASSRAPQPRSRMHPNNFVLFPGEIRRIALENATTEVLYLTALNAEDVELKP